ncbi:hypothetical protein LDENG_00221390 [Lucifuga dentata]|nr:hypothetical protein LDENG_00221390 [Lucifuga dentata]
MRRTASSVSPETSTARITAVCLNHGCVTLRMTAVTAAMKKTVRSSFLPGSSQPPSLGALSVASYWSSPSVAPANSTHCACLNAGKKQIRSLSERCVNKL